LDTKPGLSPETPAEISNAIKPYLRLVTYQLQIPQVYGLVTLGRTNRHRSLALRASSLYTDAALPLAGQLMPIDRCLESHINAAAELALAMGDFVAAS